MSTPANDSIMTITNPAGRAAQAAVVRQHERQQQPPEFLDR
ncbi:MAG: hypothetical protein ACKONH_09035 [Planctomycetia bacterium]